MEATCKLPSVLRSDGRRIGGLIHPEQGVLLVIHSAPAESRLGACR